MTPVRPDKLSCTIATAEIVRGLGLPVLPMTVVGPEWFRGATSAFPPPRPQDMPPRPQPGDVPRSLTDLLVSTPLDLELQHEVSVVRTSMEWPQGVVRVPGTDVTRVVRAEAADQGLRDLISGAYRAYTSMARWVSGVPWSERPEVSLMVTPVLPVALSGTAVVQDGELVELRAGPQTLSGAPRNGGTLGTALREAHRQSLVDCALAYAESVSGADGAATEVEFNVTEDDRLYVMQISDREAPLPRVVSGAGLRDCRVMPRVGPLPEADDEVLVPLVSAEYLDAFTIVWSAAVLGSDVPRVIGVPCADVTHVGFNHHLIRALGTLIPDTEVVLCT